MEANINRSYVRADESQAKFSWLLLLLASLVALLASIWPLAVWAVWIRPEFVALLVVYWVLFAPFRVGMVYAWCMGLVLDLLSGNVLCQEALALTIVAYLVYLFHQRLRMYALLQQSLSVFALVCLYQFIEYWIHGVTGGGYASAALFLPALSSAVCWPFTRLLLDRLRGW
ncbi:MAG: rod shape-determining protein MreD [Gammaproteobacteria bacterium]|nr:rod shape-determining protein MreD [Gammaproteobacteria bacterium]